MGNYDRPNPLLAALTKAGTALSVAGGFISYLVVSSVIDANQGVALTTAIAGAQETTAHIGGAVAGIIALVAGLTAAFGTIVVGKQGTTPVVDPKTDTGAQLVPIAAPIEPVVDPGQA